MNELALFAGSGGGILGGTLVGWRTVCAVEVDPYSRSVLLARQDDGTLPPFPVWDDVRTFDGRPWRGIVDVVSGGFPCQDISVAGKGDGLDGERSGLWKEYSRIIGEVRPQFAFVENSPALTYRGLDRVLGDLADLGLDAEWGIVSAADAGARHERKRIWILAYTNRTRLEECDMPTIAGESGLDSRKTDPREMANSNHSFGGGECRWKRGDRFRKEEWDLRPVFDQPEPLRMVDGVANRLDRLKALGNGQVPGVAAIAWEILKSRIE